MYEVTFDAIDLIPLNVCAGLWLDYDPSYRAPPPGRWTLNHLKTDQARDFHPQHIDFPK